ncbi:folate-sensitive fragile site protein Fra10Ac1-domain-containing protein [Epithele typhae]|uniref:folate-sensitive fragile site protein Fra10Ac1-domain-containing protein n=1 Tax=Epithele typhae TaxID=378194 RepID=UPI0020081326|nr:folate-sensitive fragile site protein Fra10Ac1-domain-containing protein [Epithele typhae]KAH9945036.1 folate-sensitive fragile site protein Fra10Ac1-domain-containing protein [Epithele typhae]
MEQLTSYTPYVSKSAGSSKQVQAATTEFEILKNSHQFLRDDGEGDERKMSWDDRMAKKYYSSLYREYAVCDLKHYKSGNFALRWRTEEEVLSGAGETSCGNTRCPLHKESPDEDDVRPGLTTLELPFAYEERGESKFALVKVVLCTRCCKKLMWKRNKDKAAQQHVEGPAGEHQTLDNLGLKRGGTDAGPASRKDARGTRREPSPRQERPAVRDDDRSGRHGLGRTRKRDSRSHSPRLRTQERRRSP